MTQKTDCLPILRFHEDRIETTRDRVPKERQLRIFLDDSFIAEITCSPGSIEALVVGHLIARGFITAGDRPVVELHSDDEYIEARVHLEGEAHPPIVGAEERCSEPLHRAEVWKNMEALISSSSLFAATGGAHCTGYFRGGEALILHEDVARHNTMDRVIGEAFLRGIILTTGMVCTTGRLPLEIVDRCARARVGTLASRGAPTSRAIQRAREAHMTLLGFARNRRFNCYTDCHRISKDETGCKILSSS